MNDEFEERITEISATIDQLRTTAGHGDGKSSRQLLDTLFRNVHSLKAAAQARGLDDLAAQAHRFEDLLHALRTGKASIDELPDFDRPVHYQLRDSAPNAEIESPIPAELYRSLKDDERHRLTQCITENASVYLVETSFEVSDFDRQFQQLRQELNKSGEVIATAPTVESDRINFRILYATASELYRIFDQAMRAGQSVAKAAGKVVDFSIRVDATLEKSVCDALADPLMHLVRNAVDHGIETQGHVNIGATSDKLAIRITVVDDGRGIDPSTIDRIFDPGFSTAAAITTISGRGVGLDIVKTAVEQLGGTINVSSEVGNGSTFQIVLPNSDKANL